MAPFTHIPSPYGATLTEDQVARLWKTALAPQGRAVTLFLDDGPGNGLGVDEIDFCRAIERGRLLGQSFNRPQIGHRTIEMIQFSKDWVDLSKQKNALLIAAAILGDNPAALAERDLSSVYDMFGKLVGDLVGAVTLKEDQTLADLHSSHQDRCPTALCVTLARTFMAARGAAAWLAACELDEMWSSLPEIQEIRRFVLSLPPTPDTGSPSLFEVREHARRIIEQVKS